MRNEPKALTWGPLFTSGRAFRSTRYFAAIPNPGTTATTFRIWMQEL
jgi:hypothetical protein